MNTQEILNIAGSAEAHLKTIESQFYTIVKEPLQPMAKPTEDVVFLAPENAFGVYKSTGGHALSVMGKDFTPMQPKEFYDSIINTVHECGANLDLNTLQFKEFRGGRSIEFSIKMFPLSFKNNKGLQDITNMEITFSTSYDGKQSNLISLYTERLVCTNGMVARGLEGVLKGKNTINGKAKILSYCDELAGVINGAEKFKEQMIELDKKKLNKKQIEAFKLALLGYNSETLALNEKKETKKENILERIEKSIALEFERTGQTAFGLLQGITHYTNHVANNSTTITDAEYIRYNAGAAMNNKAQELVFQMN